MTRRTRTRRAQGESERLPEGQGSSTRRQFSETTRQSLIDQAAALFADRGYAGTSLDEVVSRADVTKGALYHHFSGKQDLFHAVFTRTESRAVAEIQGRMAEEPNAWDRAQAGVRGFLAACQQPAYRRIVLQEGPVALGVEVWRETEQRSTLGLIRGVAEDLLAGHPVDDPLLEAFAQVFFGALSAGGQAIAEADDAGEAGERIAVVLGALLAGLRRLADSGGELTDATALLGPRPVDR